MTKSDGISANKETAHMNPTYTTKSNGCNLIFSKQKF